VGHDSFEADEREHTIQIRLEETQEERGKERERGKEGKSER